MSDFKIDKGVPVPPLQARYVNNGMTPVLRNMEIGDSFEIPLDGRDELKVRQQIARLLYATKLRTGKVYTLRRREAGFRVWRIA